MSISFEDRVRRAMRAIPPRYRFRLHNVAIVVEREPLDPSLLGLCETGLPHGLPDRITIFEGPHRRLARTLRDSPAKRSARAESLPGLRVPAHPSGALLELDDLVEETLIHEVGHYFGLNEREVMAMEQRLRRLRRAERRSPGSRSSLRD